MIEQFFAWPVVLGVVVGAAWNLINLWCLSSALTIWLDVAPSRRRAIAWFVVKYPLLYLAAFVALSHPAVSPVGFAIGFTVVLFAALVIKALHPRPSEPVGSAHGS